MALVKKKKQKKISGVQGLKREGRMNQQSTEDIRAGKLLCTSL